MKATLNNVTYTVNTESGRSRNYGEVPKSYTKIGVARFVEDRGGYNPQVADVFINKKREKIIEVYVDGNFYPYYCTLFEAGGRF